MSSVLSQSKTSSWSKTNQSVGLWFIFTNSFISVKSYRCRTAQWLRSLPPNPEVPGSIPGLVEGWIFRWPSFPLKFTQLSILPGSVKWVPAYMDRFEAAARGAYICFRSAGGKLIIVKRLWACYMEKALYKCTTLLYFHCNRSPINIGRLAIHGLITKVRFAGMRFILYPHEYVFVLKTQLNFFFV